MKRGLLTLTLLVVFVCAGYGQVGIGTSNPNTSAQLEIVANNKGVLIPRVALKNLTDDTTISNGNVKSLLVFNTIQNIRVRY